ncbi:MAG: MmgE/PrpD family protein [Chloroflexota bacterium]
MSDNISRLFASYVAATDYATVPADVIHEVRRRVLDSLGVGLAAWDTDTARVTRAMAFDYPVAEGATILGTDRRTTPDLAAFVNATLVRYLDFNDTYLSAEPLHPSDMIPPLLALAELRHLSGRDLITAIAIAYEIAVNLCDAASLRIHNWDHVVYDAIGVAAGAAKLLRLEPAATANAISIAVVPHASMRQTRSGELSMWKGAAAANSGRNAVFAALLAEKGMTGPFKPFEGEMGFFKLLTHQPFDLNKLTSLTALHPPSRILDTYIKYWPVEYHAQSAVDAALQLHKQIDGAGISAVHIDTFKVGYDIIAKDPEKWQPKTRETADHSIQYITVAALQDGEVTPRTFDMDRIQREDTRTLLAHHTTVSEDPELTKGYPEGIPNTITVVLDDGRRLSQHVSFPRGHARNRMTDVEVEAKYNANVLGRLGQAQAEALRKAVWALDETEDIATLPPLVKVEG